MFKRIGILTSGGDAPGMNAAIRAVVRTAIARGVECMGIYRGYRGLIEGDIRKLEMRSVSNIINHGGTILYSDRCPEFKTEEGMKEAVENCKRFGIDGIISIGGDGTFRGATDLTAHGVPCIGLPGTIDNDITSTDFSIGFDTAVNTTIEMVDRLRDTCESHARCNVVEVMGRDAGDIAVQTAIAVGASAVAVREILFNEAAVLESLRHSRESGKRNFIVIVSEGLPGYGEQLTKTIEEKTGIETRFARLAHVVRGGSPTLRDRILGSTVGAAAVECLLDGKSNIVICERVGKVTTMDIGEALILDRMYKDKLKPGDLEKFDAETVARMRAFCAAKFDAFKKLYDLAYEISK
ncbi:MAG: 6-phosphofructokinase [Clostridia bacterium]|nr:6-phosphofructokinase [Clostridia bacterium]